MGQPQKYTTDEIIAALKDTNGLVSLAARRLSCSPNTIYTRAKKVQAVQQAIDDARDELVDLSELALRSAVMDKEAWAVSLVLKTLGKNRGYVERQEVTGAEGGPVQMQKVRDAQVDRAISTLADALREVLPGTSAKPEGAVDAAEQAPVAGSAEPGR